MLTEAKALAAGLNIVASDRIRTELGILAANSDARIKALGRGKFEAQENLSQDATTARVPGRSVATRSRKNRLSMIELSETVRSADLHFISETAERRHIGLMSRTERLAQLGRQHSHVRRVKTMKYACAKEQEDVPSRFWPEQAKTSADPQFEKIKQLEEQRNTIEANGRITRQEGFNQDIVALAKYQARYRKACGFLFSSGSKVVWMRSLSRKFTCNC